MNKQLAEQHKAWVLETVDLIRMRKARPDIERISRMLKRIYGLTYIETKETLEELVTEGKINRVHFKGNVSYRRNFTFPEKQSPESNAHTTSNRIIHAIKTITKQTGDGVTFADLQQWLISKNPETRLVKHRLQNALKRELKANTITRLSDECYVLTKSLPKPEKSKEFKPIISPKPKSEKVHAKINSTSTASKSKENSENESEKKEESETVKRSRPLSKRKKFKKTHGPDFENPLQFRRLPSKDGIKDEEEVIMCDLCSCTAKSNKDGHPEPLLTCKDCNSKAHPSCMEYSESLARRALDSPWQCMECKDCCICDGTDNADLMLFCDECDKGYHMTCHSPAVANKPKGKWICSTCRRHWSHDAEKGLGRTLPKKSSKKDTKNDGSANESEEPRKGQKRKQSVDRPAFEVKRQRSIMSASSSNAGDPFTDGTVGAPSLPTPSASPRPCDTFDYEMKMALLSERILFPNDDTKYEDASEWKIDDVVKFFNDNGYEDQAQVFKDQEIDGPSLLLMRRNDVLTALGLRLGPALKIYQKIIRLQHHSQAASVS